MIAELRDGLENIYKDSKPPKTPRKRMRVDVARGGTAAAHILLHDIPEGARVRAILKDKRGREVDADWFQLLDAPVEVNTGPRAFIEKEGKKNPYVIRRAPFRAFDAMAPAGKSVRSSGGALALRMHLPVQRNARPGTKELFIHISNGRERAELRLTIEVHPPVAPPAGEASFPYTNWFSYENIASRHGVEPWSAGYWRMLRRYADLMARARQNAFWIPLNCIFSVEDGRPVLDAARLRRIVKTFTDAGMHWIEGGHFGGRTTSDWKCPTFSVRLANKIAASSEGNDAIAAIGGQLTAEIERNGWRNRWIQHVADEPIRENADNYRIFAGMVRKYMPGIPILDATIDEALVGSVDYWCPQVQETEKHRQHFEHQKSIGDKVWFYTCCSPGGPWLNRLLDQELLRPALFGWYAALRDLDGFLHWGLNHYRHDQNPFHQSVVDKLPAGDTHIVYPGKNAPWSSLRLEAQREGFEDFELLRRLKDLNPKAASRIIGKAIKAADDYTKDIVAFRSAQRALYRSAL